MTEIPKIYDPKEAEQHHYARWEQLGLFAPEINKDPDAPVFSIVIPPPNVTGSLHMGHALQHTMMDVMTRHKRMRGYRAREIRRTGLAMEGRIRRTDSEADPPAGRVGRLVARAFYHGRKSFARSARGLRSLLCRRFDLP